MQDVTRPFRFALFAELARVRLDTDQYALTQIGVRHRSGASPPQSAEENPYGRPPRQPSGVSAHSRLTWSDVLTEVLAGSRPRQSGGLTPDSLRS